MPSDERFTATLNVDDRDYAKKMAGAGLMAFRLGGMAVAGAAVAATAYVSLTRRVSLLGQEVVRQAAQVGTDAGTMQTLRMVAELTGVGINDLGKAFRTLNELWMVNQRHGGTLAANVAALGLNFDELGKKAPVERLQALLEALSAIKDPLDKLRAARGIFQGEAEGVMGIVNRPAAEVKKVLAQAAAPDTKISPEAAARGEKAVTGWQRAKAAVMSGVAENPLVRGGQNLMGSEFVSETAKAYKNVAKRGVVAEMGREIWEILKMIREDMREGMR